MSKCPFCEIPCGNNHCAYNEEGMNDPISFKLNADQKEAKKENKTLMEENLALLAHVQKLEMRVYQLEKEMNRVIVESKHLFELLTNDPNCFKIDLGGENE